MHNSKTKDQNENETELWGWCLSLEKGWNCMQLKGKRQLRVYIKEIERVGIILNFVKSQIKNPNF